MKQPKDFPMGKMEQHYYGFRAMAVIVMAGLVVASLWKYLT